MSEYKILIQNLDSYTKSHSERVSNYAVLLGKKVGLSNDDLEKLRIGALYHDIGKYKISNSILQKDAKLTDAEFAEMKKHTFWGANLLEENPNFKDIVPIIKYHHEKYDGTGYPNQLVGENIPYLARITTIADCFDAMASKRSYKNSMTMQNIIKELKNCRGTQFDPKLLDNFLDILINEYDSIKKIQESY